jgi:SulP family sulfate permease
MPAITGIYAALLPALIALLFCRSQRLGVGPTALTSMLIAASLAPLARPASAEWVNLALWLALLSGLMQLAMGALRAGWLMNLIASPVMMAFTQASALLILWSQVPPLVGWVPPAPGEPLWQGVHWPALAMGAASLLLMWGLRRLAPRLPAILAAVVLAGLASWAMGFERLGGEVVGPVPSGFPGLSLPHWPGWTELGTLLVPAAVIALVSLLETASSARVDNQDKGLPWDQDQDLIGQGLAKISAAFCGTFATSTSFSRSALNLAAGAQTAWANLVCIVGVAFTLLLLTPLLAPVPQATLAAIVIITVVNLLKPSQWRALWRISPMEAGTAAVTFFVTLATAPRIYWGVVAGIVLTLSHLLYWRLHPRIIEVGLHPDGSLRDRHLWHLAPLGPRVMALRMDAPLDFSTAPAFEKGVLAAVSRAPGTRHFYLFAQPINRVDASGVEAFARVLADLRRNDVGVHLVGLKLPAQRLLQADPLGDWLILHRTEAEALQSISHLPGDGLPSPWGDHI